MAVSGLLSWLGVKLGLTSTEFWRAWAGADTWSGEPVNADTAMQVAAFWACVRLIAQTVGTLPLILYSRQKDGDRQEEPGQPLYNVLRYAPNADQTPVDFWEGITVGLLLGGNSFAEKIFNSQQELLSLNLLQWDAVRVERDLQGGLRYRYSDPLRKGAERILTEQQIMHVRGFGPGGDVGLSPLAFARQTLGIARSAEKAAGSIFANGLRPSGWLVYKGGLLTQDQRDQTKKTLLDPMQGAGNTGKVGVLEADFDYKQMTIPPEDAQMLESRAFGVEEVCRWYGVPPVLVGHASAGQTMWGTGIEQIVIGWLIFGLRPYLARIEQAVKRSLMTPEQRQTQYAEFSVDGLLRGDSAAQASLYSTLTQNGIMTRNEVRSKMNLPKMEGADGLTVQVTLQDIAKLTEEPAPVPAAVPGQEDTNAQPPALRVVK